MKRTMLLHQASWTWRGMVPPSSLLRRVLQSGPKQVVMGLWDRIRADKRHADPVMVHMAAIDQRAYKSPLELVVVPGAAVTAAKVVWTFGMNDVPEGNSGKKCPKFRDSIFSSRL